MPRQMHSDAAPVAGITRALRSKEPATQRDASHQSQLALDSLIARGHGGRRSPIGRFDLGAATRRKSRSEEPGRIRSQLRVEPERPDANPVVIDHQRPVDWQAEPLQVY